MVIRHCFAARNGQYATPPRIWQYFSRKCKNTFFSRRTGDFPRRMNQYKLERKRQAASLRIYLFNMCGNERNEQARSLRINQYNLFKSPFYCFFICRRNSKTAAITVKAAYPNTHQKCGRICENLPASTARSISTA